MNTTKDIQAGERTQHTPGPWTLHDEGDKWDVMGGGNWIASAHSGYDSDEANARLIAAAPELLEACKWLMSLYDDEGNHREQYQDQCSVAIEKAEAAIAKAEGKPALNAGSQKEKTKS